MRSVIFVIDHTLVIEKGDSTLVSNIAGIEVIIIELVEGRIDSHVVLVNKRAIEVGLARRWYLGSRCSERVLLL